MGGEEYEKMRTAIVEDDKEAAEKLSGFIRRYGRENGRVFDIAEFKDTAAFLFGYKPDYDLVFMDIEMPGRNGMDGAKKLREFDPDVPLVFVTGLMHYAVKGYEVGALDYLVKPYSYEAFEMTFSMAVKKRADAERSVTVRNMSGYARIPLSAIYYVEVNKHRVIYHTDFGLVDVWGSMKAAEKALPPFSFAKCGASWLVNLGRVKSIEGDSVVVGGDRLKISRAKKKAFLQALNAFVSYGGGI